MDIKEALTFDGLKYFYTKYIKPLKTGAFSTVVNNATTTVANTVLDGRMGKTLADKDANLQNQINTLNSSLTSKIESEQAKNINADKMMPSANMTKCFVISDSTGTITNNFPVSSSGLLLSTNLYNVHYLQIFFPLSSKGIYLRGYRQNESWSSWAAIS